MHRFAYVATSPTISLCISSMCIQSSLQQQQLRCPQHREHLSSHPQRFLSILQTSVVAVSSWPLTSNIVTKCHLPSSRLVKSTTQLKFIFSILYKSVSVFAEADRQSSYNPHIWRNTLFLMNYVFTNLDFLLENVSNLLCNRLCLYITHLIDK